MVVIKVIVLLVTFFIVIISVAIKLFPLSKETKISLGYSNNVFLNFTEVAVKNHYTSEEHTVTTEDGYILTIFRIAKANCHKKQKQRPILLMHGMLQNSDVFLDAGPSAGLGYLLSEACFDVWVGNQRGNNYGRRHLRLDPDKDPQFWQFSVDEIGFYDVPASIDYILKHTGADKINYVGFSQGSSIFLAMGSERPEYCKKIGVMIALAPAVYLENNESVPLRFMLKSAARFERIFKLLGVREVFSKGQFMQEFFEYLCQVSESSWIEKICASGAYVDSYHSGSVASDTRRLIFSHTFVGTSLNILVRYGQVVNTGKFQKFDYGEKVNLERYNSTAAPEYNLTAITCPVVIIQGKNDKMVNVYDAGKLSEDLPNVLEMAVVSDPNWTHLDMVYSQNIKAMIFPKMNGYLEKYSQIGKS